MYKNGRVVFYEGKTLWYKFVSTISKENVVTPSNHTFLIVLRLLF